MIHDKNTVWTFQQQNKKGFNYHVSHQKHTTDVRLKMHIFKLEFSTNKSDSSSTPGLRQIVSLFTW